MFGNFSLKKADKGVKEGVMGVSLQVPWFRMDGFGPLGLSLDPADYGQTPVSLLAEPVPPSAASEGRPMHAEVGGAPVSFAERLFDPRRALLAAASSPPPSSSPPSSGRASPSYVLNFLGGKYRGTQFPLRAGQTVVVGRSTKADLILIDALVTDRHARILVTDTGLILEDLGSVNGTFVNGERIHRPTPLKPRDRILIGSSSLIVEVPTTADAAIPFPAEVAAVPASVPDPMRASFLSGRFGGRIGLPDLLQFFQMLSLDGVLEILGDQKARLHLRKGGVFHTTIDGLPDLDPLKAFFRLIACEKGEFELLPPDEGEVPQGISLPPEILLMESIRQLDELRHLEPQLPSRSASLSVAPPTQGRVDLTPAEIDLLKLIPDHANLQALLDASPLSDLDTCQALLSLLRKRYVQF